MTADPSRPSGWWPGAPENSSSRAAKHRLVAELRRLVAAVHGLAPDTATPADLDDISDDVRRLTERAESIPRVERPDDDFVFRHDDTSLFERSPLSGLANPIAPPLQARPCGDTSVEAIATYGAAYEGPPGGVHGGIVMAAFDEVLGLAQHASGFSGLTGTLSVRMLALTPLDTPIHYRAEIEEVHGRRVNVVGRSHGEDQLLGEAEGVFVVPRAWMARHSPA